MLPSLFLSHGSPMIAIERSPASEFLDQLGPAIDAAFGRPKAVLVMSPHTATRTPYVLGGARHEAIHDFGGFPAELYQLRYDAPGAPALSHDVTQRLAAAGVQAQWAEAQGLDHGIWTIQRRMWPQADMPVVPLSLVPTSHPAQLWAMGAALAPLAEQGVLIIGSGSFTHNLRRFFSSPAAHSGVRNLPVAPDVAAFQDWVLARTQALDWPALLNYRAQAPGAAEQHPTDEHWLPFYLAAGAGGEKVLPQRLHASVDGAVLAMDGYAFGPGADVLARALA